MSRPLFRRQVIIAPGKVFEIIIGRSKAESMADLPRNLRFALKYLALNGLAGNMDFVVRDAQPRQVL